MFGKIKVLSVSIIMGFLLAGCQEVEKPGQDVPEKDASKAEIEKKVDFSDVYTPSEVSVYSASFWEAEDDDYIVRVFLGDKKVEKLLYAMGPQYTYAYDTDEEEVVNIYDGGESLYGYSKHIMEAGVSYGYAKYDFDKLFPEFEKISREYANTTRIISKELDEKDSAFIEAKKEVTEYLEKLHMENYAVDAAAIFEGNKKKGCRIYWNQVIDNIPVSQIMLDKSGSYEDTMVYNSKLNYNTKMGQASSVLETAFVNGRLTKWRNQYVINVGEKLKQFPLVSVEEAYKKVEEQISNYHSEVRIPILEMVELQYKIIELDEKIYLYPVWTFCVSTEEQWKDGNTGKEDIELKYNYFLVDAITGDYFTDIDTKALES